MNIRRTAKLGFLVSTVSVLSAPCAWAQEEKSTSPASITDIIVTAQRYEESAQRAPIIIETISADETSRMTDLRQIQNAVPSMQFANAGAYVQTYVRGVGTYNGKSTQETAVAYSVDGIYVYNTTEVSPNLYDLARIEVLKGPQGTLYGRNATGGAVNLITQGAKLGELEGYIEGEVGNYDLVRAQAALNVPVSSTFAVRFAGRKVQHDGYLSDGRNDDDTLSGRVRALWEPTTDVSLKLNFDAARIRRKGFGIVNFPFGDSDDPWIGTLDPRADVGVRAHSAFRDATGRIINQPYDKSDQWSASAQLDWNLGFATLTLLPAYRYDKIDNLNYSTFLGTEDHSTVKQKSFEARLAGNTDRLRWVAGAYYLDVDIDQLFIVRNPSPPPGGGSPSATIQDNPNEVNSWAVFGEATYNLTDSLRLIGGMRYTWDRSIASGIQNRFFPAPATSAYQPGVEVGDYPLNARVTNDAITWKVGAQYDVGSQSTLFATVSRGYKAGGSFNDLPTANKVFKPEFVTAYELGSRNRFLDNTLQVNLEAFYWTLKDQQFSYTGYNDLNLVAFVTRNAANAEIYGLSTDVLWLATPNDRFHVAAEYLHTEYTDFVRAAVAPAIGTACSSTLVSAGPPPRFSIDCSGMPMTRAPKWTGSASYEHRFDFANGGNVTVGGDMTFSSSRYIAIDYSPATRDKGYALFNAEIAYHAPDDRWSLALWGMNLTKEAYIVGGVQIFDHSKSTINQPRTYGVRMRANF